MGKRQRIKDSLTLTLVMSKLGGRYNDHLTLTVSKIWGHPTFLEKNNNKNNLLVYISTVFIKIYKFSISDFLSFINASKASIVDSIAE